MITKKLEAIIASLCESVEDSRKNEDGNDSAGTRVRKVALTAAKDLKELRKLILENQKKRSE